MGASLLAMVSLSAILFVLCGVVTYLVFGGAEEK